MQIASLNSPSAVIKSIFEKLYTLFFIDSYSDRFFSCVCPNRSNWNTRKINKLRKKDLLPVYLIGFSVNQVIRLELLKIFILTNMVCFLSIGMGVTIAFILSEVINPNFFGWRIPIKVFPKYWLQIWIIATLASVFSTILSFRMSNVKTQSNFDRKIFTPLWAARY